MCKESKVVATETIHVSADNIQVILILEDNSKNAFNHHIFFLRINVLSTNIG